MPFVQGYEGFPLKKSEVDHDFWMVQSGSHMWLMESLALVQTGIQWFTFGCPQTVCPGGVLSKDSVYIYIIINIIRWLLLLNINCSRAPCRSIPCFDHRLRHEGLSKMGLYVYGLIKYIDRRTLQKPLHPSS